MTPLGLPLHYFQCLMTREEVTKVEAVTPVHLLLEEHGFQGLQECFHSSLNKHVFHMKTMLVESVHVTFPLVI